MAAAGPFITRKVDGQRMRQANRALALILIRVNDLSTGYTSCFIHCERRFSYEAAVMVSPIVAPASTTSSS